MVFFSFRYITERLNADKLSCNIPNIPKDSLAINNPEASFIFIVGCLVVGWLKL